MQGSERHLEAVSASRVGRHAFTNESDDRIIVDHERRLFAVADGSGPTYGGYYAPLGMEVGLASILRALSPERHAHSCDERCLRAAFGEAQNDMHDLDVAYHRVFERELTKAPEDRLGASLRACQEIALTRFGRGLDTFAHFHASVTALHFTERSVVVAQVGSARAYRFRDGSLELLLRDHTLETVLAAEGTSLDEMHRGVVTRMLGMMTANVSPDIRCETVERGDRYVICSDGVWNAIGDAELARVCASDNAHSIADSLMQRVDSSQVEDDASVIVVTTSASARDDPS